MEISPPPREIITSLEIKLQPIITRRFNETEIADLDRQNKICKRRGITLPPVITKCLHETIGNDCSRAGQKHKQISCKAGQDGMYMETQPGNEGISRWSISTEPGEDTNSSYSGPQSARESDCEEFYDETLERYREFFENRPLMRCLDSDENQLLGVTGVSPSERLFREIQKPGQPSDERNGEPSSEAQVKAFWDGIRNELSWGESSLEIEWPGEFDEYPETFPGTSIFCRICGWRISNIFEGLRHK